MQEREKMVVVRIREGEFGEGGENWRVKKRENEKLKKEKEKKKKTLVWFRGLKRGMRKKEKKTVVSE